MQTTASFSPTNLPEDSCWQLFQHYAFSGTSDTVPTHLVDMGMDIMRKCGGLPLAVKSIASLLRHETYEECWREILESDLWESNPSNDIFPALQISYAHLPSYLKPCFLFCSMYPKDHVLTMMNLIEIWISHGYIEPRGKRKITEIGVEYYEELKQRSFLDDIPNVSAYEYCKLHDIIHDLARLNSENEHYSVEINWPRDIQEKNVLRETYHLYARGSMGHVNQILQQKLEGLGTLSMYLSGCSGYLGHQYNRQSNLTKFVALRVLELNGDFTEIPDFILESKHLVYLGITSSKLKILPLSIGLLYNLQTLILDHCHLLEYLPESIGDLANLQYLYIQSRNFKRLPKSLCSSNLLRLVIKSDHLEEVPLDLRNLHNLREITIFSPQQTLAIHNTIGSLSSLEKLNLSYYGNTLVGYVPHGLVNFPAIKKMATGLRVKKWQQGRLSIEGIKMSNLVNAQRANLRNKYRLEALDLCWDRDDPDYDFLPVWKPETCEGGLVGANDVDFSLLECLQPHPNLEKLLLNCYPSTTLPRWMRDPFSLQSIQEISLKYCFKIQSLPFGKLHTLKHLNILSCFSIRVLQLEKLPSRLETLQISNCNYLELITGQGYQDNLSLVISYCGAIKSIARNTEPHIAQERVSSLPRLKIECCDLLRVRSASKLREIDICNKSNQLFSNDVFLSSTRNI
ncbi:putative disease resistance protein RGA4 [Carex rostrata]